MTYPSLHHHTCHSYMDGYGLPSDHASRLAELGYTAGAVTEHGNVSSHVQHEQACAAAGIKPIFGLEAYYAEGKEPKKNHLTLLAMDQEGYRNLNRIVTESYVNFYRWPTVNWGMLESHSDGIVVLSGCSDSELSCALLGGKAVPPKDEPDWDAAREVIARYKAQFGDRYYLECQAFPELERTRLLNSSFEALGAEMGVQLVATADVHYPHAADNEMQVVLHAAGRGAVSVDAQSAGWNYDIALSPPTSDDDWLERMRGAGLSPTAALAACETAAVIAERCTVTLPKMDRVRFPLPPGKSEHDLIWQWLREGWQYRWARSAHMRANAPAYAKQLKYEMSMIEEKDFRSYFLMLSELVRWCKDNPKPVPVGPARGSAAASVAVWLLRISEVDPMLFPTMVFERFIDVTRMDDPDIDLDFSDEQRWRVREHLAEVWGADHVGNIGNFVRYRGKNAVNDVARVHSIPPFKAAIVNDLIVERSGGDSRFDASLEDTFAMFPKAQEVLDDHPELWKATRLEGNYKGSSVHAAGLVVANDPINQTTAMYQRATGKDKRVNSILPYDKYDCEYLGMMKIDALGLTTMGMLDLALGFAGLKLEDLYDIPLDDPATLAAFKAGDVIGIFQFEGRATRLVNSDVSPDHFMHLADINALSRPGPLFSGQTAQYVEVKHGRAAPMSLHPLVDEITVPTNGQIIYQEQILKIVRAVGNFPWTHAAAIRSIISKKKGEAAFNAMWGMFEEGAATHGIESELALKIWKYLITSGTYSFNVAHSISYSMLAYWCQWMKVHHPVSFYAAQFRKTPVDKIKRLMRDAVEHGIQIMPPDLQSSGVTWTPDAAGGAVVAGFSQLPRVGEKMAATIVAAREEAAAAGAPWDDWSSIKSVKGVGPKLYDVVLEFASSDDPFRLEETARQLNAVRDAINDGELRGLVPRPTHTSDDIPVNANNLPVVWAGKVVAKNYQDFVENQRARYGEETEAIIAKMRDPHLVTSCVLQCVDDGHEEVYVRFNRWAFPKFKEQLEELRVGKDVIVVRGTKKQGFGIALHASRLWTIDPDH